MTQRLLLVDYENVPQIDLSGFDERHRAIVFVGANQNPPKAAHSPETAHRFKRVEFQKISRSGKNALDFHIAFHLKRIFETARDTSCVIISRDKGFDALLTFLNSAGLSCQRVDGFAELRALLLPVATTLTLTQIEAPVCARCKEASTIELHGGRWCSRCGRFTSRPDPALLPSNKPGYVEPRPSAQAMTTHSAVCGWCNQASDMSDGIYDDGEWMCGVCIAQYVQ